MLTLSDDQESHFTPVKVGSSDLYIYIYIYIYIYTAGGEKKKSSILGKKTKTYYSNRTGEARVEIRGHKMGGREEREWELKDIYIYIYIKRERQSEREKKERKRKK